MTTWLILFAQLLVLVGAAVLLGYIRGLPDRIHEEGVRRLEFSLNSQLEEIRASLTREIELLKISQTELQVHKNTELIRLSDFFTQFMTNPDEIRKIENSTKAQKELKKNMYDLGMKLFFFASDETVREFTGWRNYAQDQPETKDSKEMLRRYGRLMLMIRKDFGHSDTGLDEEDFLRTTIVDWDKFSGA